VLADAGVVGSVNPEARPLVLAPAEATKTIKAKVLSCLLTKRKLNLIEGEYENYQRYLHGDRAAKLYSATRQQAERRQRRLSEDHNGRDYPLIIRRDVFALHTTSNRIARHWARIPVHGVRGGVWVPIRPHEDVKPEYRVGEAKLIRREGEYYLHVAVTRKTSIPSMPDDASKIAVIAIDLGDRKPITAVALINRKHSRPEFLGKEIRQVKGHYRYLRKMIGKAKSRHGAQVIKRIGDSEHRTVMDLLHKATSRVIEKAEELRRRGYWVIIALGDARPQRMLKRRRYQRRAQSRLTRHKIATMPTHTIRNLLTYKGNWDDFPVAHISENGTSVMCHRCGGKGKRLFQGLFTCPRCGLEYNADANGAINIGARFLEHALGSRANLTWPMTHAAYSSPDEGHTSAPNRHTT